MAQGQGGKIINTASIAGRQGYAEFAPYCASKASVISLTQAGALTELAILAGCLFVAWGVVRLMRGKTAPEGSVWFGRRIFVGHYQNAFVSDGLLLRLGLWKMSTAN